MGCLDSGHCPSLDMTQGYKGLLMAENELTLFEMEKRLKREAPKITASMRIYEAVKRIPKGKVATYGDVAAMAGNPKMSRAVGNALHKNPDPKHIPCHRVVNSEGRLSGAFAFGGPEVQAERLRKEGVEVRDNQVDLSVYRIDISCFI